MESLALSASTPKFGWSWIFLNSHFWSGERVFGMSKCFLYISMGDESRHQGVSSYWCK